MPAGGLIRGGLRTSEALPAVKTVLAGTHRICPPEETLRRIEPHFAAMGITRLADLTWLDDIGIPVWQAVRPNSYTLSVAQGKGLTGPLAKVSAAMEAIETWHAERLRPGRLEAVGALASELPYNPAELPLVPRHHLNQAALIEWSPAVPIRDATAATWVPMELVRLDGRVVRRWQVPLFHPSSNGLASGNTLHEATLHSLYEVIERDAATRAGHPPARFLIDQATVDGDAGRLLEQFRRAGVDVRIDLMPSPMMIACLRVRIVSDAFPSLFQGMGCHLDRQVALCRALTEAAQGRLTAISGVRDDMPGTWYRRAARAVSGTSGPPALDPLYDDAQLVDFESVPSTSHPTLEEDLAAVAGMVAKTTGREPLVVDHTRAELGIPVTRVICPGLLYDPELT
ncbi:YcaO-like family protein [Kribbella sp. NPDC005582]|uniref:YcaO-like family protein n=1 Tax=Kribbella sp. NPDC005582 TaxID=3156893 RepID=UPI0033BD4064